MDNPLIWTIVGLCLYSVGVTVILFQERRAYLRLVAEIDDTLEILRKWNQE